jgi:hypothetical protein
VSQTKKSFILYHDQRKQVEMLSDVQAGVLIKAIYRFVSGEEVPEIDDGMTQMCFSFISSQIARDAEAYDQKCKKLLENARRGGQATAAMFKQKQANGANCSQLVPNEANCSQLRPNEAYTDTVTDIDIDIDTDIDTDTGTGTDTVTDPYSVPSPALQVAPQNAPQLTSEERERLLSKGLPSRYLDERVERASEYAAKNGGYVYDVLMEWWKTDRARAPWNVSQTKYGKSADVGVDSFDIDDFFQAALRKSYEMP